MKEQEYFIKNIDIIDFKCFKNFKAKGFGRVNLIGGKNNVGKTAFMEACYLSQSETTLSLFEKLLEIKTHRNIINNLLLKTTREEDLQNLIKNNIGFSLLIRSINEEFENGIFTTSNRGYINIQLDEKLDSQLAIYTKLSEYLVITKQFDEENEHSYPEIYSLSTLINILNINFENTKYQFSLNFISPYSNSNKELENIIGQSKLDEKYDDLNKYLSEVFNVTSIDIIKNKPMLKSNGEYKELSHFGQGIKTFINIVASILLLKDDIIFIDEIENGIHYTNLDKLWEIILTISKQQNVQVFATTHSKECIESYARVAKKLEDEDITFIKMTRLEDGLIMAGVRDYGMLQGIMEDGHEVRGW